jgi:hypothetical protein
MSTSSQQSFRLMLVADVARGRAAHLFLECVGPMPGSPCGWQLSREYEDDDCGSNQEIRYVAEAAKLSMAREASGPPVLAATRRPARWTPRSRCRKEIETRERSSAARIP